MRRNEKGFTYPLTLVMLLLFLLVFSFKVEQLLTERKLVHETAVILQEEYYFHTSVKKIEIALQSADAVPVQGMFSYQYGEVTYQAAVPIKSLQSILFTLRMKSGETVVARGFFDTNLKRLIKWVELN
ncbi:competence type IV pilus minor pilin ComGG [Neobacillus sp. FSL H8-0543]|uniref:competence type IV pilus minor pilin ComGG n=1 Tax=Neobacillus sp. FSL H8-0543 TaxID=2954672 RepID=UPI003158B649